MRSQTFIHSMEATLLNT